MSTVIVGAGISGLALAHGLRARGEEVQVLEASARAGGTIRSSAREGFLTEAGPNGFLDREPATRALAEALGLTPKLRPAAPTMKRRFIFTRGALREVPSSPPAFLRSDVVPLGAKLRMGLELFSGRAPAGSDEPLASFARRHLGATAAGVLVDAMQSGIFAGDPERLSLAATFPRMAELEREHRSLLLAMVRLQREKRRQGGQVEVGGPSGALCSFEGGLETLVARAAAELGDVVRLNAEVRGLTREGGRWRLAVEERGVQAPLEADRVVLALPSYGAAQLVRPLDGALADELAAIEYARVGVVHVGFAREQLAAAPEGFGFLVPGNEGRRLLGTIFVSSIFPWRVEGDRVLFTCMVGGARRPELLELDDGALLDAVREELRLTLGIAAQPRFTDIVRWDKGIPQYNVGHLARVGRIEAALERLPGLVLTGNALKGVGLNDCVRNAAGLAERLAGR